MNHSRLFLKTLSFNSSDSSWPSQYLRQSDARLTALLKDFLGNSFWEKYSQVLIRYFEKEQLMLRIKSVTRDTVDLTQVWRNEEDYKSFLKEATQGYDLRELLKEKGVLTTENNQLIQESEVPNLISHLTQRDHLIQFINGRWLTPGTRIGDPLKQGRNYLPFPDQE